MKTDRWIIRILVLLGMIGTFGISGVSVHAAGTGAQTTAAGSGAGTQTAAEASSTAAAAATAAAATKKEVKHYTANELCCMAKYFYKKSSKNGYYPPEAVSKTEEDGTISITLRERIEDENGEHHYKTYAKYNVSADGRGTDAKRKKSVDLTVYSKIYTPEELCKLAQDFYYRTNDFYPPNA